MSLLSSLKENSEIVKAVGIRTYQGEDGQPVIEAHKSDQIKTLEQLLTSAEVDTEKWEVLSHEANVWNQMSSANGLVNLWQVKAKLKIKDLSKDKVDHIMELAMKGFKRGSFKVARAKVVKRKKTGRMAMLGIPDLHLGKLSWSPETGHGNWDCKIAQDVWEDAINKLIEQSPDCDECWFPVGNDFFNVDNDQKTTNAGTAQDEDGRWQKTFDLGVEISQWAISRLLTKFKKVNVIMVYGNHDTQRSYYLGSVLYNVSKYIPGLTVDNRPLDRKYFQWGESAIAFTHGDRLKKADIPGLFQAEARELLGKTKRSHLYLGHFHHLVEDGIGGVKVITMAALCPPDKYHAKHGYVMADKGATLRVYDERSNYMTLDHLPGHDLYS